jgi:hypothetical protein
MVNGGPDGRGDNCFLTLMVVLFGRGEERWYIKKVLCVVYVLVGTMYINIAHK